MISSLRNSAIDGLRVLVLLLHTFSIPICASYFLMTAAFPLFWPPVFLYILHIFTDKSYKQGRHLSATTWMFRRSRYWKLFAEYFPIKLHKTVDLPPSFHVDPSEILSRKSHESSFLWQLMFWWYYFLLVPLWSRYNSHSLPKPTGRRYIFGYHPHGIISMGMIGGVISDGAGWSELFPGIPVRALTLDNQFWVPFYREYLLLLGLGSVSQESCKNMLENNQPICIVVGGARESLLAHPGKFDLVLGRRLGFVKLGLQTRRTSLVPILAFGENELYDQVENDESTFLYKIQHFIKRVCGFTLPFMNARGIFNYDVGLLPFRKPINIVVGRPIDLPYIPDPTFEDLTFYHRLYIKELKQIFKDNKKRFFPHLDNLKSLDDYKLRIVD